jgi:hypothetical protein
VITILSTRIQFWLAVLSTAALLSTACSKAPTAPTSPVAAEPTAANYPTSTVAFTSDPQHFVGRGQAMTFTMQNAVFTPVVGRAGGMLQLTMRGNDSPANVWSFSLTAPGASQIAPGTFQTANDSSNWNASFSGGGRSCGRSVGRIVIHSFSFSPNSQTLRNFRASYEVSCDSTPAMLRAEIAILADPWR